MISGKVRKGYKERNEIMTFINPDEGIDSENVRCNGDRDRD